MDFHVSSFALGLVVGSSLYAIVKCLRNRSKKPAESSADDCFLFDPQKFTIKCVNDANICEKLSCPLCNFKKFLDLISSTTTHLDICMYLITTEELARVVLNLFSKGVFVRIIVDKQMSIEANSSKVHVFLKEHVPVKIIGSAETMHNKFVVIDKKKVVTGSFNWTKQAVQGNFENMVVVHDSKVVRKFDEYFQDIWLTPLKI